MPNRINFPSMFMALIRPPTEKNPFQAVLRVAPSMNKLEIREYLTKIYNIPVKSVNTANVMGRRKRVFGSRRMLTYKRPDYKLAFINLEKEGATRPKAPTTGSS